MIEFLKGYKSIGVKCVYKKKMNVQGEIERYKAHLVVKGYKQKAWIDYDSFCSGCKNRDNSTYFVYCCITRVSIYQLDVKFAFLNGFLVEDVYV